MKKKKHNNKIYTKIAEHTLILFVCLFDDVDVDSNEMKMIPDKINPLDIQIAFSYESAKIFEIRFVFFLLNVCYHLTWNSFHKITNKV